MRKIYKHNISFWSNLSFQAAFNSFNKVVIGQVREPHVLCNRSLTGQDIADFMPKVSESINAGHKQIVPESIFQQMESRRAEAVLDNLKTAFDSFSNDVERDLPLTPSALERRIEDHKINALARLQRRLSDMSKANVDRVKVKLYDYIATAKTHLSQKNTNRIMDKARLALEKGLKKVRYMNFCIFAFHALPSWTHKKTHIFPFFHRRRSGKVLGPKPLTPEKIRNLKKSSRH